VTNLLADEVVEGPGARHERPGILPAETHPFRDLFAPRSGQAARQRIAKQRVRAFGFPGAVDGDPERSVRNVLDQRFSVRHDCKPSTGGALSSFFLALFAFSSVAFAV
jgi:hypothetical protein